MGAINIIKICSIVRTLSLLLQDSEKRWVSQSCSGAKSPRCFRLFWRLSQCLEDNSGKNFVFQDATAAHRTISVTLVTLAVASVTTAACSLLLLTAALCHHAPRAWRPWVSEKSLMPVDDLSVCLCGLAVCMLSKLLLGKGR